MTPYVLVVEDEPSVRELTAQALEERGYRVQTAPTADHALDLLRSSVVPLAAAPLLPMFNV